MKRYAFSLLLLTLIYQSVFAIGALFARRPNSLDESRPLWLKSYDATVTITEQMAVTHVDQTFKNESADQLEGIFVFPLPENAVVTELALWIDGVRQVGSVLESQQAKQTYESIVRRKVDPALLEYMGNNVFKLSVFPIEPSARAMSERRIEITYMELLKYDGGNVAYQFLMRNSKLSAKAPVRTSLTLTLTSERAITSFLVPELSSQPQFVLSKVSNNKYSLTYGTENTFIAQDLNLTYQLQSQGYALNHLTYTPDLSLKLPFDAAGDDPYFLLWVTPPAEVTQAQVLRKSVVFVADVSSSMMGTRIVQLRQALDKMVDLLNPGDQFNILAFSNAVQPFKPDVVTADASSKAEAKLFIAALSEAGMTNIQDAMTLALAGKWTAAGINNIVFLTDGKPTWPVSTSTQKIIDTVAQLNKSAISLYTFGVGADVDSAFLRKLAKQNSGFATFISTDNSISMTLENFMRKISFPLIKGITVAYGGLQTYDVYPRPIPNLYVGTQLTQIGRFRNNGEFEVTFSGSVGASASTIKQTLAFPKDKAGQPFVPRMWASSKIDYLLNEIAMNGVQPELKAAVIALGVKYNIITPYTSMLVVEPPPVNPGPGGNPVSVVIEDKTQSLPSKLTLVSATPDVRTGMVSIRYAVPKQTLPQKIVLRIYDGKGRVVRTLVDEYTLGGNYTVTWNALDDSGNRAAPGLYVALLEVGNMKQMLATRLVK